MLVSMTGFAHTSLELANKDGISTYLTINIKTLNSRFFEAVCKMPYQLQALEVDTINLLKKELVRGKVSLTIHSSNPNIFKGNLQTALPIVDGYLKSIRDIQDRYKLEGSITISDILNLPDVFIAEDALIDDQTAQRILEAIKITIAKLQKERLQEGAALEKDIIDRLALLAQHIAMIEQRSREVFEEKSAASKQLLADLDHEKSEFAEIRRHEITIALEKSDITEELVRFKNHLNNVTSCLKDHDVEKGRRFDFMLQELNREINTIAAKCSDSGISNLAITTKIELEKIREQIQNIV